MDKSTKKSEPPSGSPIKNIDFVVRDFEVVIRQEDPTFIAAFKPALPILPAVLWGVKG